MAKNEERIFFSRMEFCPIKDNIGYYNLRPCLEFVGTKAIKVEPDEFPKYGTINVKDAARKNSSNVKAGHYYVLRIGDHDIMSLEKNANGYCIEFDEYLRRVRNVDTYGVCEIIEFSPYSSPGLVDFAAWGYEAQDWMSAPLSTVIYLSDRSNVVGPFTWVEREGKYYMQPCGQGSDIYMVDRYLIEDIEIYGFSERDSNYEWRERRFILKEALPSTTRGKIDCISDTKLKEITGSLIAVNTDAQSKQERRDILKAVRELPTDKLSGPRQERVLRMAQQGIVAGDIVTKIANDMFSSVVGQKQVLKVVLSNDEYLRSLHALAKEDTGYDRVLEQLHEDKQRIIKELEEQIAQKRKEIADAQHELKIAKNKSRKLVKKGKKGKNASQEIESADAGKTAEEVSAEEVSAEEAVATDASTVATDAAANAADVATAATGGAVAALEALRQESEAKIEALQTEMRERRAKVEAERAEDERQRLEWQQNKQIWQAAVQSEQKAVLDQFESHLQQAYAKLAFDGPIASAIMQSAARYEDQCRFDRAVSAVRTLDTVTSVREVSPVRSAAELAQMVTDELNERGHRQVRYNDVANLLICLSQSFLTIITGEPGTGKSSLVAMVAHILGLDNPQYQRYQEIAVEHGWTSRRDLVGYYNPLTRTFEAANRGMYHCLSSMKAESECAVADFPYLVLLDEATLSPMEHYWADFMSISDLNKRQRQIALSNDYVFPIAPTLRFVATVNVDQTNAIVSSRLLDRAWVIRTNPNITDVTRIGEPELLDNYPLVPWSLCAELNDSQLLAERELDNYALDTLNELANICYVGGRPLSPRTLNMVFRYCLAAKGVFDTSAGSFAPLDYAIAQKVLPLLDGYGEKQSDTVSKLLSLVTSKRMMMSEAILSSMESRGRDASLYYGSLWH